MTPFLKRPLLVCAPSSPYGGEVLTKDPTLWRRVRVYLNGVEQKRCVTAFMADPRLPLRARKDWLQVYKMDGSRIVTNERGVPEMEFLYGVVGLVDPEQVPTLAEVYLR